MLCGRLGAFNGSIKIEESFRNSKGFLNSQKYGVLLENPGVYPKLSIKEYLQYFSGFYGYGADAWTENGAIYKRCKSLAERLNLPPLDKRLETLSLGNRQKVQIVRAMLHNPKLLILDEPVANLDPISRETVWHLLDEWRTQEQGTAIVCSHVLAEMDEWATDYAIIDDGQLLKAGTNPNAEGLQKKESASFEVNFAVPVTNAQIEKALLDAGLVPSQIAAKGETLGEIYREVIR